jgi:hypothetical protein
MDALWVPSVRVHADRKVHKGFTSGILGSPPTPSKNSYYNISRTVRLEIRGMSTRRATAATSASAGAAGLSSSSPFPTTAKLQMINSTCANPKKVWQQEMGSVAWYLHTLFGQGICIFFLCFVGLNCVLLGTLRVHAKPTLAHLIYMCLLTCLQ